MATITSLGFSIFSTYNGRGTSEASRALRDLDSSINRTSGGLNSFTGRMGAATAAALAFGPALIPIGATAAAGAGALASFGTVAGSALGIYGAAMKGAIDRTLAMAEAGKKLTPVQTTFVKSVDGMKAAWEKFLVATQPQTLQTATVVVQGLTNVINAMAPVVRAIHPEVLKVAQAFKDWTEREDGLKRFVNILTAEARPAVGALGNASRDMLAVMGIGFRAFLPFVTDVAQWLEKGAASLRKWAEGGGFQRFIAYVRENAPGVKAFFSELWQFVKNLATALMEAAPHSLALATGLLKIANSIPPGVLLAMGAAFVALKGAMTGLMIPMAALRLAFGGGTGLLGSFTGLLPLVLKFAGILGAFVSVVILAWQHSEFFRDRVNQLWQAIQILWRDHLQPLVQKLQELWDKLEPVRALIGVVAGFILGIFVQALTAAITNLGLFIDGATAVIDWLLRMPEHLQIFVTAWNAVWTAVKAAAEVVWQALQVAWDAFVNALQVAWTAVSGALVVAWNAVWSGLQAAAQAVWTALQVAWSAFTSALATAWTAVSGALVAAWNAVWSGIQTAAQAVWTALQVAWSAFTSALATAWSTVSGALVAAWNAVWSGIQTAAQAVWTALQVAWSAFVNALQVAWTAVSGALVAAWNAVWSGIQTAAQAVWTALQAAWSAFVGALATAWSAVSGALVAAWNAVWSGIQTAAQAVWTALQAAWSAFVNTLTTAWNAVSGALSAAWSAVWNAIQTAAQAVWTALTAAWSAFINGLASVWSSVSSALSAAWSAVWSAIQTAASAVWTALTAAWSAFVNGLSTAWNAVSGALSAAWSAFWSGIQAAASAVWGALQAAWNAFLAVLQAAWSAFSGALTAAWNALWSTLTAAWSAFSNAIGAAWQTFYNVLTQIWSTFSNAIGAAWQTFFNVLTQIWSTFSNAIGAAWQTFWNVLTQIWSTFSNAFGAAWQTFYNVLTDIWSTFSNAIGDAWQTFWNVLTDIWSTFSNAFGDAWQTFYNVLTDIWSTFSNTLGDAWEAFWNRLRDLAQDIWHTIGEVIETAINGVITMVNGLITGFNRVTEFLDLNLRIGPIDPVNLNFAYGGVVGMPGFADGGILNFAGGGAVPGYAPGRDRVPAMLSPGEGVLVPEAVRGLGGADFVHSANNHFSRGRAPRRGAPNFNKYDSFGGGNQLMQAEHISHFARGGMAGGDRSGGGHVDPAYAQAMAMGGITLAALARAGLAGVPITQPEFNPGVAASAGTHDGGGVIDLPPNPAYLQKLLATGEWAAWMRTPAQGFSPHIHAVLMSHPQLSPAARAQVASFRAGGNGLGVGGGGGGAGGGGIDIMGMIAPHVGKILLNVYRGLGPLANIALDAAIRAFFSPDQISRDPSPTSEQQRRRELMDRIDRNPNDQAAIDELGDLTNTGLDRDSVSQPPLPFTGRPGALINPAQGSASIAPETEQHSMLDMLAQFVLPAITRDHIKVGLGDAYADLDALPGDGFGTVAKGFASKILDDAIPDYLMKKAAAATPPMLPGGTGLPVASAQAVQAWAGLAAQALQRAGIAPNQLGAFLALMQAESGGNPNAINRTDINAQNGVPSQGLMQVIPPTFATYRDPLLPNNILDPLANMTAAARYIKARYGGQVPGSPYALGTRGAQRGWHLVGEHGPEWTKFRGGEKVLPNGEIPLGKGGKYGRVIFEDGAIRIDLRGADKEAVKRFEDEALPKMRMMLTQKVGWRD